MSIGAFDPLAEFGTSSIPSDVPPISDDPLPPPRKRATRTRKPKAKPVDEDEQLKPKPQIARKEPSTAEIEKVLAEILSLPAIPAKAIYDCDFCMAHFLTQGPETAKDLAKLSEDHPAFRGACVKLVAAWTGLSLIGVLSTYVGKPVVHHGPRPLYDAVGPVLKVPPQPAPPVTPGGSLFKKHNHQPKASSGTTASETTIAPDD